MSNFKFTKKKEQVSKNKTSNFKFTKKKKVENSKKTEFKPLEENKEA